MDGDLKEVTKLVIGGSWQTFPADGITITTVGALLYLDIYLFYYGASSSSIKKKTLQCTEQGDASLFPDSDDHRRNSTMYQGQLQAFPNVREVYFYRITLNLLATSIVLSRISCES